MRKCQGRIPVAVVFALFVFLMNAGLGPIDSAMAVCFDNILKNPPFRSACATFTIDAVPPGATSEEIKTAFGLWSDLDQLLRIQFTEVSTGGQLRVEVGDILSVGRTVAQYIVDEFGIYTATVGGRITLNQESGWCG